MTDDGWPSGIETSNFASVTGTVVALTPPDIDVGTHYLLAGATNQEVQIYVTGLDKVTGFNLNAQLGDGSGGNPEPNFQSIEFAGGIWDAYPYTITGGVIGDDQQLIQASIDFDNTGNEVLADGLLVTLAIDTSGFSATEIFDLKLSIDAGPLDSEFILYNGYEIYPTIVHGEIILYESNVVNRHVFYNNSSFDGYDPTATVADDNAVATDKSALFPGEVANFDNYTSYWFGINGVIIDINDLSNPTGLSLSDFTFEVGNSDDTSTWSSAPAPTVWPVREGAGTGGSDRITLTWDDNEIRNEWLQVTVLATANTGLAEEDVFYFGNAVGEVGNSATSTYVDGVDFAATRDHFRNFLNLAEVTDRYDHNRDKLVDGTDLAIVRDNQTNILTALKLITPTDGMGGGDMMAMQEPAGLSLPVVDNGNNSADSSIFMLSEESLVDDFLLSSNTEITNHRANLKVTQGSGILTNSLKANQDIAIADVGSKSSPSSQVTNMFNRNIFEVPLSVRTLRNPFSDDLREPSTWSVVWQDSMIDSIFLNSGND